MEYQCKVFVRSDHHEMNAWMLSLSIKGFKLVNFKAVGHDAIIIFMEK